MRATYESVQCHDTNKNKSERRHWRRRWTATGKVLLAAAQPAELSGSYGSESPSAGTDETTAGNQWRRRRRYDQHHDSGRKWTRTARCSSAAMATAPGGTGSGGNDERHISTYGLQHVCYLTGSPAGLEQRRRRRRGGNGGRPAAAAAGPVQNGVRQRAAATAGRHIRKDVEDLNPRWRTHPQTTTFVENVIGTPQARPPNASLFAEAAPSGSVRPATPAPTADLRRARADAPRTERRDTPGQPGSARAASHVAG